MEEQDSEIRKTHFLKLILDTLLAVNNLKDKTGVLSRVWSEYVDVYLTGKVQKIVNSFSSMTEDEMMEEYNKIKDLKPHLIRKNGTWVVQGLK